MDPKVSSSKAVKDGDWEFPEDIAFPVDVRVMVKMYKVAEIEGDAKQTKYLNTKIIKVEACLQKEDLLNKINLLAAIERDGDIKKLAGDESISNPKMEISIKRQDAGEIFTVTKMGFVVRRLEKLKDRSDTILLEVKEQLITFQPKQPTIKIMINSEHLGSVSKVRWLVENVQKALNDGLMEFDNTWYDKETRLIICGKCSGGVKVREKGAVRTIINYFNEKHFKICGNKERKRKAKQELEETSKAKKRKETEKMDKYWANLVSKPSDDADLNLDVTGTEEDFMDPDLIEDNDDMMASAGMSSSTG